MTKSEENISLALRDLETLRSREKREAEERRQELYRCVPGLLKIDNELSSTASGAISYYLKSGERDKNKLLEVLKNGNRELRAEKAELLRKYGFPADYAEIRYQCPYCQDTGFVQGKKCRCLTQRLIRMSYETANLGEMLKHQHFGVFNLDYFSSQPYKNYPLSPRANMEAVFDRLFQFAEDFPNVKPSNIFFYGSAGTGKTFLCSCLAKALLDRGFTVLYLSADDLCSRLEKSRFNRGTSENDEAALIQDSDLLIIDDLGTEIRTMVSTNLLINCINQRLISHKSTVISSNLVPEGITENYSERLASRIMGAFQIIELYGPDLRITVEN